MLMKYPLTQLGIEPANFRIVAQQFSFCIVIISLCRPLIVSGEHHRRNCGRASGKSPPPPALSAILFLSKESFFFFNFGSCVEEGQIKRGMRVGKRGCMFIKNWFKLLLFSPVPQNCYLNIIT